MTNSDDAKWIDNRPIDTLKFGQDKPNADELTQELRATFTRAGCKIAEDIAQLGCTGLYGFLLGDGDVTPMSGALRNCAHVRENMAGAGIGLTCFVDLKHFCLVHNTIGGLQDHQQQHHAEYVLAITRDLTDKERGHIAFVESTRRIRGKSNSERMDSALDSLTGLKLPEGLTADVAPLDVSTAPATSVLAATAAPLAALIRLLYTAAVGRQLAIVDAVVKLLPPELQADLGGLAATAAETPEPWKCSEHAKPFWPCRFCAAQAVVEGPLEPQYLLAPTDYANLVATEAIDSIAANEVDDKVVEFGVNGATAIGLFVKAAAWRERFAKDE